MAIMKRHGSRVVCSDKCLLVYKGKNYPCIIENISVSGALLLCNGSFPKLVKSGEICGMMLCNDPILCPSEYRSKVARFNATNIALQFLEMEF